MLWKANPIGKSMPYRKQAEAHNDREATLSYYECVDEHNDCPVCGEHCGYTSGSYYSRELRFTRCYPEKRVAIEGMWWWKKTCPLEGVHDHYRCKKCNAVWVCFHVKRQPSKKRYA